MIWLAILLMTALVFLSRYLFLEPSLPLNLRHSTRRLLAYSGPAVLTAICGPLVFAPQQSLWLGLNNPYLIGALVTVLMIWKTGKLLLTVGVSMVVFLLHQYVVGEFVAN